MSKPTIEGHGGIYKLTWVDEKLEIMASRMKTHSDGRITGEIKITTTKDGNSGHLYQALFNFSAARSRSDLAKTMDNRYPRETTGADWESIAEQLAVMVVEAERIGEPLEEIWTDGEFTPPEYLLHPLIPKNMPTVVYGNPGSLKSFFGLFVIYCVTLPWTDNPLNLVTLEEPTHSIVLDFETFKDEYGWRSKTVMVGAGVPPIRIPYQRCSIPLSDDMENIKAKIIESGASFAVVDSLGMACGGDLIGAERANKFFLACRQLNITILVLAHDSKENRTIYGSQFFQAGARSVWEMRRVQEVGDNEVVVGLFHKKANPSGIFPAIGFRVVFGDKTVCFQRCSLEGTGLSNELPLPIQIKDLLRHGAMSNKEISEELAKDQNTVRVTTGRMQQRGQLVKLEGKKWGLAVQ